MAAIFYSVLDLIKNYELCVFYTAQFMQLVSIRLVFGTLYLVPHVKFLFWSILSSFYSTFRIGL